MGKLLFIIASDYPFGPGEPFLEDEVKQIEKSFEKVFFLITSPLSKLNQEKLFYIPKNAEIILINQKLNIINKSKGLRWLISKTFWLEISFIQNKLKIKLNYKILKICLYALAKGFMFKKKIQLQLKQYINSSNNQCYFYSYWCTEYTLGLAFLKQKYPQIFVLTRAHGWDVYFERNNPPYLPFRQFILDKVNMFFTISENGKKYLENKLINSNNNLIVSKLGVFKAKKLVSQNFQNDTLQILSLAYVNPVKRLWLLIDALTLLNIKTKWVHIGGNGEFKNLLTYSTKNLSKLNISFHLLGNLSKAEIADHLQKNYYDFLINTSYTEGIPVSMMEAMSFGIPVIGTNVGGVSEIINDGINGYLMVRDPSPEEIVQTIIKFHNLNIEDKARFRQNALETWNKDYNAEINYTKFIEQILKL